MLYVIAHLGLRTIIPCARRVITRAVLLVVELCACQRRLQTMSYLRGSEQQMNTVNDMHDLLDSSLPLFGKGAYHFTPCIPIEEKCLQCGLSLICMTC